MNDLLFFLTLFMMSVGIRGSSCLRMSSGHEFSIKLGSEELTQEQAWVRTSILNHWMPQESGDCTLTALVLLGQFTDDEHAVYFLDDSQSSERQAETANQRFHHFASSEADESTN